MDLSKINNSVFFNKYLTKKETINNQEFRALCPFHSDTKKPNMHINTQKGIWYCFVCQKGGNVVDFYKKITGRSARDFAIEYDILHVKDDFGIKLHEKLLNQKDVINYLEEERGISLDDIKLFKLGYDDKDARITIPIYDEYGILLNIRKYNATSDFKMISYKKGYGSAQLFPIRILNKDKFILCEGEWDCILSNSKNLPAVTVTGGAGHWKDDWIERYDIKNKEIYIIFDCDDTGRFGAKKVADILVKHNKVKIVDLKLKLKEDITDWFIKYKKTPTELFNLIQDTDYYISKELNEEYDETVLGDASNEKYYNRSIMFKSIIAGKDLAPYQIPKEIEMECKYTSSSDKCKFCYLNNGYAKLVLDNNEDIIECVNVTKQQLLGIVRKAVGIYRRCQSAKITKETKQNIEEIKMIPEVDFADEGEENDEYVVRKAYYIGNKLKTNQTYLLYGTTLPDPKNQQTVHVIKKAIPIKDSIEEFKLNNEIKAKLQIFKKLNGQSIREKLDIIYKDFTYNVTHIYNRYDLILAYDLVFHSILNFNFLDENLGRGWLELFVLGDSRAGKSRTIKEMIRHYKAGERITAEGSSYAGLVAGLQQTQMRWTLMWGKIPLNDKRLVAIDEAHTMEHDDWSQLSDIRSSGVAEVTKIQIQKTTARTRKIFIANPPKRRLVEYSYGVLAMKDIIGQNEDISRFDFAMSVSDMDVKDSEINRDHGNIQVPHIYTSDLCHNLIMFAWSRKPNNIIFKDEAMKRILELSIEMSKTYSKTIPLVQGAEIRIKLAKLSVALATRLYNTDEDGENVIVEKEHVDFIFEFLTEIYKKDGFDYYDYSQQRKKETVLKNVEYIDNLLNEDVIDILLDSNQFTVSDFSNIFNLSPGDTRNTLNNLISSRAIRKKYGYYVKTSAFIIYLKEIKIKYRDGEVTPNITGGKNDDENYDNIFNDEAD